MADRQCVACQSPLAPADTICPKCGAASPSSPTRLTSEQEAIPAPGEADPLTEELREALAPRLQLVRPLGHGGMGVVYLARDPALKRLIVIKVLAPTLAGDPRARARFAREAESAAAVSHPNVVNIFEVGELPKSRTAYFGMQYIEGATLEVAFPPGTHASVPQARRIIGEVAAALAAAHARGLAHRDIKPSNVMLDRETGRAVVLDFGISSVMQQAAGGDESTKLTAEGVVIGTPTYMSPEQPAGDPLTEKSDVYSLGVLAFELVTGRPPFSGTSPMQVISQHLRTPPPKVRSLRPDLEPRFAELIDRCLAKEPGQRPTAAEVARYLLPPAQPVVEWPPPGLEPIRGAGSTLRRRIARLAVLQLVLFGLIYSQPTSSTGSWPDGERVWLWRTVWFPYAALDQTLVRPAECALMQSVGEDCPPARIEAAPLWSFTLTVVWILLVVTAIRIIRAARLFGRAYTKARAAGYTGPVLKWVLWDEYTDTGDLLSGSGPLALVPAAERMGIVEDRRRVDQWVTYALIAASIPPLLWLFGLLSIGGGGTRWLTIWEMILFTLPLAVAMTVRVVHRRRVGGHSLLRRTGLAVADVRPELVKAWLAGAPADLTTGRQAAYPSSLAATVFAALVLFTTGLTMVGAWFFNVWTSPTTREWALDWLASAGHAGDRFTHWAELDSVVGVRIQFAPRGRMVALRGAAAALTREDTSARALESWRVLAASAVRTPSRRYATSFGERRVDGSWWDNARRNLSAAGNAASSRLRIGENLSAARYLWHSPYVEDHVRAGQLLNQALALEARRARAAREGLEADAARETGAQIFRYLLSVRLFYLGFEEALMADPRAPVGRRFLADRHQAPAVRRSLALAALSGFCYNGREMLFGLSDGRRALVAEARTAVPRTLGVNEELDRGLSELGGGAARRGVIGFFQRLAWCRGRLAS
jgi:protein kinase-like protein